MQYFVRCIRFLDVYMLLYHRMMHDNYRGSSLTFDAKVTSGQDIEFLHSVH